MTAPYVQYAFPNYPLTPYNLKILNFSRAASVARQAPRLATPAFAFYPRLAKAEKYFFFAAAVY